jgi:drug/metabolite transporter (DMT)-like permease
MIFGILAGLSWAIETVVLGIALSKSQLCSTGQAVFLAPFVSTFIHDAFSAVYATLYNAIRGNFMKVWHALFRTRTGKWVAVAAVIGGPVGMTGYVLAVNCMGAAIGAVASSIFPAVGAVLAYIFLKERIKWYQWMFLAFTILGVFGLSYSGDVQIRNFWLGLVGALLCSFGWGIEAVVLAKCFKDADVTGEYSLQIRQTTSALIYGIIIIPVLRGWDFTVSLFSGTGTVIPTIAVAAFFATASYLCYYKAISKIGASKAMALDITYSAWAMLITVVILRDFSVFTPLTVICSVIVLVCGIFAAADFKEIFRKNKA